MASAVAIDAEYTITRPIASSNSAAHASVVSKVSIARLSRGAAANADRRGNVERSVMSLGMRHLLRMRGNGGLETIAALDVVAEHVEARARGRQQARRRRHVPARSRVPRQPPVPARIPPPARTPASAAAIAGASRPSSTTARQCASTPDRSGEKSCPLPSPPAINAAGRSIPSSAASVAATVVAFESFTKSTFADFRHAFHAMRQAAKRTRAPQARWRRSSPRSTSAPTPRAR